MMLRIRTLAGLSVIVAGTLWTGSMATRAQEQPVADLAPIWKGAFTTPQAEGGKVPFTGLCRRCHSDNLMGSERGPALKGESFMEHWEQQDLDRLKAKIRDTMPPDDPGKLSDDEYLGLVSYILMNNGYPAGSSPLDNAALSGVQIVRKPGEERPLRSFSVVQVVGCLVKSGESNWQLAQATEPVLTRERASTAEELKALATRPLGARTFDLVSLASVGDMHPGQKVEVKGLLYKSATTNRVNVSSLQAAGGSCGS
jgi:cytochrome c5